MSGVTAAIKQSRSRSTTGNGSMLARVKVAKTGRRQGTDLRVKTLQSYIVKTEDASLSLKITRSRWLLCSRTREFLPLRARGQNKSALLHQKANSDRRPPSR